MISPGKPFVFPPRRTRTISPSSLWRIGYAPSSSTVGLRVKRRSSKSFKSGNRRYLCQSSEVACNENHSLQPAFILLVKRDTASSRSALAEISAQFGLTQREGEAVDFLLQGLTTKEIATRMQISPNTVKAFVRLVMVKMKVSTRSGIAGKIAGSAGYSHVIVQPIEAGVVHHRREYLEA